ncbi:hypothetical protein DM872_03570 [Pseudomonas taiwanensis]|nr:hypothetical protein [Pseudomonas taiwanensis]
MRRIFCRRFEGSISLGNSALSRKSDRGIAESVKPVANGQAGFGTAVFTGVSPALVGANSFAMQAAGLPSGRKWGGGAARRE